MAETGLSKSRLDVAGAEPIVGLVPAAGLATRLGRPAGSKELLPVWRRPDSEGSQAALPVVHCLLASFEAAGAARTVIVFRSGKEDIPDALGSATRDGMRLEYVRVDDTPSPPFTLNAAVPALSGATVLMGFPDVLFEPPGAVKQVLGRMTGTEADAVLGLFPHPRVRRADIVEVEASGTGFVRAVRRTGNRAGEGWTWGLAAWRPRFTDFLHDFVAAVAVDDARAGALSVGDVFTAAIESGLSLRAETVSDQPFLDIGTPEALEEAYRRLQNI